MLDTDQHLACGRCWRFGKVGKLEDDSRLAESSDSHCTHSAPPVLVMAEFDEVRDRQAAPGLLQAATRRETAEIVAVNPKLSMSRLMNAAGSGWSPETKITRRSSVLHRPFIEAGGDDRIERLDDAGTWRQGRTTSLAPLPPRSARDEGRTRLDEGIVASMSTRPFQGR